MSADRERRRKRLGGVLVAVALTGCAHSVPEVAPEAPITIFATQACADYFPGTRIGLIGLPEKFTEPYRPAYAENLAAFDEPCLPPLPGGPTEAFRFLWLRSFDPPIVVRFERWPDGIYTVAKVLPERGLLEARHPRRGSGSIAFAPRRLTEREESEFVEALALSSFWARETKTGENWGNDGAIWIFEGWNRNRYHAIEIWSPSGTEAARVGDLGVVMLRLAGVRLDPKRIY